MAKRSRASKGRSGLSNIILFLMVVGLGGWAYWTYRDKLSQPATVAPAALVSAASSSTQPMIEATSTPILALDNGAVVTVLSADGKAERMPLDAFMAAFGSRIQRAGSQAANGSATVFAGSSGTGKKILTSPGGAWVATLGAETSDGASVVILRKGTEDRRVPVRLPSGEIAKEARLLGWFDDNSVGLVARASSTAGIYVASAANGVRRLTSIPDSVLSMEMRSVGSVGSVWYTTAQPGEGMESPPQPPSELHQVKKDGMDALVRRDESGVIGGAIPGPAGLLAYTMDAGTSFLSTSASSSPIALGSLRPLLFLNAEHLLVRRNGDLAVWNIQKGTTEVLAPLPEGNVNVYMLDAEKLTP